MDKLVVGDFCLLNQEPVSPDRTDVFRPCAAQGGQCNQPSTIATTEHCFCYIYSCNCLQGTDRKMSALAGFDGKYKGVMKDDILKVLKSLKGKQALEPLLKNGHLEKLFPEEIIESVDDFINLLNKDDVFSSVIR